MGFILRVHEEVHAAGNHSRNLIDNFRKLEFTNSLTNTVPFKTKNIESLQFI